MNYGPLSLKLTIVLICITSVSSTFSPSGSVFIDCGGQQTFTCTVAANGPAAWTITGITGIRAAAKSNGVMLANDYYLITTTDTTPGATSAITISEFSTFENGATVQCVDQLGTDHGNATVVIGNLQCGQVGVDYGGDSCPSFTFTPEGNRFLPSVVVVSYQLVGDPSSAGSLNCAYPIDPRMCRLVVPGGTYNVRLTPQNSCGAPISTCSSRTEIIPAACELLASDPISSPTTATEIFLHGPCLVVSGILSGVVPSIVLILISIISVVVVFLVTRHCYKKSAKGGSSSRREEHYEQAEVHEDINMTDSAAYRPTTHAHPVYM